MRDTVTWKVYNRASHQLGAVTCLHQQICTISKFACM